MLWRNISRSLWQQGKGRCLPVLAPKLRKIADGGTLPSDSIPLQPQSGAESAPQARYCYLSGVIQKRHQIWNKYMQVAFVP
jgi:hypothetical protein